MYNGQIIKDLLRKRKIQNKTLNEALGWNNSQLKQVVEGNPKVSTLELVADFFHVSMDVFFERNISVLPSSNHVLGDGNNVNSVVFNCDQLTERIKTLEQLLHEKDKRIETLEKLNSVYEENLKTENRPKK